MAWVSLDIFAVAAIRHTQQLVEKAPTVLAPMTLGFADCFALLLSLALLLISSLRPVGVSPRRRDTPPS